MGKNRRRRTEAEAEAALTEKAFMMRKVQRWDGIRTSRSLNRSKPQLGLGWSSLDATGVSPTLDPGPLGPFQPEDFHDFPPWTAVTRTPTRQLTASNPALTKEIAPGRSQMGLGNTGDGRSGPKAHSFLHTRCAVDAPAQTSRFTASTIAQGGVCAVLHCRAGGTTSPISFSHLLY